MITVSFHHLNFCDLFLGRFFVCCSLSFFGTIFQSQNVVFFSFSQIHFRHVFQQWNEFELQRTEMEFFFWCFDVKTKLSLNVWKQLLCKSNGMIFIVGEIIIIIVINKMESNRRKKKFHCIKIAQKSVSIAEHDTTRLKLIQRSFVRFV